ncbi:MAG: non-canonical purine NTP pyrophosphatase [Candidatus Micrarchaeota archaeon]|nr:MAG: non-canonical purine NTP pyrophosphatase [Candidatus Micrarchaeota archaeon]
MLYLLTKNRNKYEEIAELCKASNLELLMLPDDKIELQADTLEEVARYAAEQAYSKHNKPVIVDDSGLFIDALNGFPGVYTSYVKKTIDSKGILRLMDGVSNRAAYFKTVIAYADSDRIELFEGIVRGMIADSVHSGRDFGFDNIFIPEGYNKTFSELSIEEKNSISHRARAFNSFLSFYKGLVYK